MTDTTFIDDGKKIKSALWKIWGSIDPYILSKFNNLNGKTAKGDVPIELFQKRTSRTNRVLLRWKILKKNQITLEQLETFYGGVCVEFVNEDYFDEENQNDPVFIFLKSRLGSNEKISSIISFRNEDGDSGANVARTSYQKFIDTLPAEDFLPIVRNVDVDYQGKGDNSVWLGNHFVSIRGGNQTGVSTHQNRQEWLFNPAIEYANELVCLDMDLTMSYFALHSSDIEQLYADQLASIKPEIEKYLKQRVYDTGDLLSYCTEHPSLKLGNGVLVDPIRLVNISINNFKKYDGNSGREDSVVICHDESADKAIFHFDEEQQFILSAARPTNLFWATHLSNMMQQNYSLDDYFEMELARYELRKKLLNK